MHFSEPLSFTPIYQKRPWGGRTLEHKLGRSLPAEECIGESWEFVDRPDAQSLISAGPLEGSSLHSLWTDHRDAVFGVNLQDSERFPLLVKLLDAREHLSVQVHPSGKEKGPAPGEPKNEWWYILGAEPAAAVFAGFNAPLSQAAFEAALSDGSLESLLHTIPVKEGDSIYVPGGRCHAIGGGCLIAEIQQNSDTTFRVFDWNRRDSEGRARALHPEDSLACMNFSDVTPSLAARLRETPFSCEFFDIQEIHLRQKAPQARAGGAIFCVLSGSVSVGSRIFSLGDWFLLPVQASLLEFSPNALATVLLQVRLPGGQTASGGATAPG